MFCGSLRHRRSCLAQVKGERRPSGGSSLGPSIHLAFRCFMFYYAFKPLETPIFLFFNLTSPPASPSSHLFILFSTLSLHSVWHKERQAERERRAEINVGPSRRQTCRWMNRRDRSAALAPSLCQAAGPLWREIISKLLQEADACQKMLSVKVRPLLCSLFPSPCLRRPTAFFIFSPLSAFLVPIIHCFSFLLKGFSVTYHLNSFILLVCL